ncbi:MAG: SAM-dependent methyltransferase, partial [Micromonosporaceae bacterium]|nr:SAM-dependent methyltransferase [Micromonosporaceae bacterium]
DPVAVEHSLAVLDGDPLTAVVQADLRDPDRVLNAQETVKLLDFRQPVALLLLGVLHQVVAVDPVSMIGGYRQAMAEGSHLALSHASQDHRPQEARAFERTYNKEYTADVSMTLRSRDEVLALFGGFELVEPGLVQLPEWRPDERDTPEERPERFSTYAGVGRLASVIHG